MSGHKGKFKSCEVDAISSKLKFVSKYKPGQKISVTSQSIQDNTYMTSLVRYLTGESREKVFKFINDLIEDAFSILNSYAQTNNEYDRRVCKNMIIDLINMRPCLENLKITYQSDHSYISRVETMIDNLNIRIQQLCDDRKLSYEKINKEAEKRLKKAEEAEAEGGVATNEGKAVPEDDASSSDDLDLVKSRENVVDVKSCGVGVGVGANGGMDYLAAVNSPLPPLPPSNSNVENDEKKNDVFSPKSIVAEAVSSKTIGSSETGRTENETGRGKSSEVSNSPMGKETIDGFRLVGKKPLTVENGGKNTGSVSSSSVGVGVGVGVDVVEKGEVVDKLLKIDPQNVFSWLSTPSSFSDYLNTNNDTVVHRVFKPEASKPSPIGSERSSTSTSTSTYTSGLANPIPPPVPTSAIPVAPKLPEIKKIVDVGKNMTSTSTSTSTSTLAGETGGEGGRSKKKPRRPAHQYDSYYIQNSEDIHLYHPDLHNGLLK